MCPDIAVWGKVLGVQGAGVEQAPIGAVFCGKIAVGHGNEHPGRQEPPIEHLEEFALGVSKRQGSGLQVLDVALED